MNLASDNTEVGGETPGPGDRRLPRPPSLLDACIPMSALIVLLGLSLYLFGLDTVNGPVQVALIFAALVGTLVALKSGHSWDEISDAASAGILSALGSIFILLAVGALNGSDAAAPPMREGVPR